MPGVENFVSSQPQYSLLWRAAGEGGDPALRGQRHLADRLVAARPGRADRQIPPGQPAAADSARDQRGDGRLDGPVPAPRVLEAVQRLAAARRGGRAHLAQFALAWVLREPNVASAIVGASRPEQLDENAAASGVRLGQETLAAIDAVLADVVVNPG